MQVERQLSKVGIESDVAYGAHAVGLLCTRDETLFGRRILQWVRIRMYATIANVKALQRSAIVVQSKLLSLGY